MENSIIVKNETGEDIKIELLLSFEVEEYNKQYIAYSINDKNESEVIPVLISEIDINTKKLKSIPEDQKEIVLQLYENAKKSLIEN